MRHLSTAEKTKLSRDMMTRISHTLQLHNVDFFAIPKATQTVYIDLFSEGVKFGTKTLQEAFENRT